MATDTQPKKKAATNLPVGQVIDNVMSSIDLLGENILAFQAIHQIVAADSQRAETHLPLLKREALSALLGVLNDSLEVRWKSARVAANVATQRLRGDESKAPESTAP
ncbi:MAG: hypothetical protein K2W93_09670 [Burkholderiaceae bacterium]|nr:hypothetical protein [Burkholderiaceae bacterium]